MITPQNIFRHEFIGLKIKVVGSSHPGFIGIEGKIVDETKNTIKIEDDKGKEKIIPKKVSVFHFELPDGKKVEIDGKIMVARPEDRIKKRFKKY
jgi:ribonuclease P protein subunit POP4